MYEPNHKHKIFIHFLNMFTSEISLKVTIESKKLKIQNHKNQVKICKISEIPRFSESKKVSNVAGDLENLFNVQKTSRILKRS